MNLDMTLAEFFALAAKVGDAARVIREAQAMMGGVPTTGMAGVMALPPPAYSFGVDRSPPVFCIHGVEKGACEIVGCPHATPKAPSVAWTPAEMAERERLRAHREAATEAAVLEAQ